jgi:hypothetical protein
VPDTEHRRDKASQMMATIANAYIHIQLEINDIAIEEIEFLFNLAIKLNRESINCLTSVIF